jgi:hypothetical protein
MARQGKQVKKQAKTRKDLPVPVVEGLYFCGQRMAEDEQVLEHLGITHVLSVGAGTQHGKYSSYTYLRIGLVDTEKADLLRKLPECVRFIDQVIGNPHQEEGSSTAVNLSQTEVSFNNPTNTTKTETKIKTKTRQRQRGAVLVHCKAGISRSASVVMGYLLYKNPDMSVAEALAMIKVARPVAQPNPGFLSQLELFRLEQCNSRTLPTHQHTVTADI